MSRLIETIQAVLLSDRTIAFVDAVLACVGLMCTVGAAVPAVARIRRAPGDRS